MKNRPDEIVLRRNIYRYSDKTAEQLHKRRVRYMALTTKLYRSLTLNGFNPTAFTNYRRAKSRITALSSWITEKRKITAINQ